MPSCSGLFCPVWLCDAKTSPGWNAGLQVELRTVWNRLFPEIVQAEECGTAFPPVSALTLGGVICANRKGVNRGLLSTGLQGQTRKGVVCRGRPLPPWYPLSKKWSLKHLVTTEARLQDFGHVLARIIMCLLLSWTSTVGLLIDQLSAPPARPARSSSQKSQLSSWPPGAYSFKWGRGKREGEGDRKCTGWGNLALGSIFNASYF